MRKEFILPAITSQTMQMVSASESLKLTPQEVQAARGFNTRMKKASAIQLRKLDEATKLWEDYFKGHVHPVLMREAFRAQPADFAYSELNRRAPHIFNEAISSSDFGHLSDALLYQSLGAQWEKAPRTYDQVARVRRGITDFRARRVYDITGMEGAWPQIKELEGFDRVAPEETYKEYTISKYAQGFDISWEAYLQDNINAFADLPQRIITGGYNTIERFAAGLVVDANGPHASFFDAAQYNNVLPGNPRLSVESYAKAIEHFIGQTDDQGNPIVIRGVTLVVTSGEDLIIARNIKNATEILMSDDGTTANGASVGQQLRVKNWLADELTIVYNPWYRIIATAAGINPWFVFANPNNGKPAIEIGFMRGFDAPAMFKKAPDAMRIGGGLVEDLGDYERMGFSYKGLIIFGGAQLEPRSALASWGDDQAHGT